MHIAIFTGPVVEKGFFVSEALTSADKIIAADCGANTALRWGIFPTAVIGDFDSLDPHSKETLQQRRCEFFSSPNIKDETDTEMAIGYAIEQGATRISLIGGIGGERVDHAVANLSLTYHPKVPIYLVNGPSKTWAVVGPQTVSIQGSKDDLLSLLPLYQVVTGIKTQGLYYPLLGEPLYFGKARGVSNVFAEKEALVTFAHGVLLLVHTSYNEAVSSKQ